MSSSETLYSFAVTTPDYIQRERTQLLKMPAYYQGALATPASGTFTLKDPNGTAYVSAAAVTVTAQIATYSLLNTTIPASTILGDGWIEEWALVMPDGTTRTARRTAAIALRELFPTVSLSDARALQTNVGDVLQNAQDPTGQDKLAFAWGMLLRKVQAKGNKPYKILNHESLHEPLVYAWLWLINRDARASVGDGTFRELAQEYKDAFEMAWKDTQLVYDTEEDGLAEADQQTKTAETPTFLSSPKASRWAWP